MRSQQLENRKLVDQLEDSPDDNLREMGQAQPDSQALQLKNRGDVDQLEAGLDVGLHPNRQAQPDLLSENPKPVDQLDTQIGVEEFQEHPAIALLKTRPELFARQGSINPTWRRRNGLTFGPYYRLLVTNRAFAKSRAFRVRLPCAGRCLSTRAGVYSEERAFPPKIPALLPFVPPSRRL